MDKPSVGKKDSFGESVHQLPFLHKRQQKLFMKCWHSLKALCKLRNDLMRKKKDLSLENIRWEEVDNLCNNMTNPVAVLLQMQLKNCVGVHRKKKWTNKDKMKALSFYKRSPPTYILLRRLFHVPSQKSLDNFVNELSFDCGINSEIFAVLKNFHTGIFSEPFHTACCLVFGSMPLKKKLNYNKKKDLIEGFVDHGSIGRQSHVANSALVFTIVGIKTAYFQPIVYYFCDDSLTPELFGRIIKQVLRQCFKADLRIRATVCDFSRRNRNVLKYLGATMDHPYFSFCQREIATIFDPFDLVIRFRNLFMKFNIKIKSDMLSPRNEGVAKWDELKLFYNIDQKDKVSLGYHLTEAHLCPNEIQKKDSYLAATLICSNKVSSGMALRHRIGGELSSDADGTIILIHKMANLFDALTAGTLAKSNGFYIQIEYRKPQYINDLIDFLNNIEFIGKSQNPLLEGWKQTLKAIEKLWWILIKHPRHYLKTQRLNGKAIKDCFDCIIRNCGHKMKPTVREFTSGLKTSILTKMSQYYISEYETHEMKLISSLKCSSHDNCNSSNSVYKDRLLTGLLHIEKYIDHMTERGFDITEGPLFISEVFLKTVHMDCSKCQKMLVIDQDKTSSSSLDCGDSQINEEFLKCVTDCVTRTHIFLSDNAHKTNLRQLVVVLLKEKVNFELLASCAMHNAKNIDTIIYLVFYLCVKNYCELINKSLHWVKHLPPTLKHDHPYI